MSRKRAIALLLGAIPANASADTDALLARYLKVTRVTVQNCIAPRDDRAILVCARRQTDRYRVPFIGYDAGDPRGESVSGERNRLASTPRLPCGQTAIIANCGTGVGVSVGTSFGINGFGPLRVRPLAKDSD